MRSVFDILGQKNAFALDRGVGDGMKILVDIVYGSPLFFLKSTWSRYRMGFACVRARVCVCFGGVGGVKMVF